MVLRRAALFALLVAGCKDDATVSPLPVDDQDVQPKYDYPLDGELRLQHIQAKSTHNSYHVETAGNQLQAWDYTMQPLDVQAGEQGVRHVELDISLGEDGAFHVFHIAVLDAQTTCELFTDCLKTIKGWSDAHRGHHLFVVQIEPKDAVQTDYEGYFAKLHAEIRTVWPEGRILTPAVVQGTAATLGEAVAKNGWPTLGATRGKVMFTMDNSADMQKAYTHDRKSLDGRILFPDSAPGDPFAAYAVRNDPHDATAIGKALAANMLVRTRADSDSVEAASNDHKNQDAALASGAHFISTDYPAKLAGKEYFLAIPGGTPSRCNPITAPKNCTPADVENPKQLLTP
jgi:hypothetical protein